MAAVSFFTAERPAFESGIFHKGILLGERLDNVSAGYQLYILLQMLVLTSAFAYLMLYLYKKGVLRCIRIGVLLWFALFTMHPVFAISSTKDVLCAAFFLYYATSLFRLLLEQEKFAWYSYGGMILAASRIPPCMKRSAPIFRRKIF